MRQEAGRRRKSISPTGFVNYCISFIMLHAQNSCALFNIIISLCVIQFLLLLLAGCCLKYCTHLHIVLPILDVARKIMFICIWGRNLHVGMHLWLYIKAIEKLQIYSKFLLQLSIVDMWMLIKSNVQSEALMWKCAWNAVVHACWWRFSTCGDESGTVGDEGKGLETEVGFWILAKKNGQKELK